MKLISVPRYTIHCGYEIIGGADTYEEAQEICRQYCKVEGTVNNRSIPFQKVFDTYQPEDRTFVLSYQFRTLYVLTFLITDHIILPEAKGSDTIDSSEKYVALHEKRCFS